VHIPGATLDSADAAAAPLRPEAELGDRFAVPPGRRAAPSLAGGVDVTHYALDLTLGANAPTVSGTAAISFRPLAAGTDTVAFDLVGLSVSQVREGATNRTFTQDASVVKIALGTPRAPTDSVTLVVSYGGNTGNRAYYSYERNSYTFVEPSDARYWFPCHDDPSDKATSEIRATVPTGLPLYSNGVLADTTAGPGTTTWHWVESHQIATYLIAVTFGTYTTLYASAGSLPLLYGVWPEDVSLALFDFAHVPDMIAYDQDEFGPYPFDKYGMVAISPFRYGGMEHQSMSTINRTWLTGDRANEPGIAHELAHQWWGDKVTLASWAEIWLNEGFATYGDLLYRQHAYGDSAFRAGLRAARSYYFSEDAIIRYPIYDPPRNANGHDYLFGLTEYYKGAWVLHMLRSLVGDTAFRQILRTYGDRFAYANATTRDFESVCEEIYGASLAWFFDQWIYQAGYPVLQSEAYGMVGDDGLYHVVVGIIQTQVNAPTFTFPLPIRFTTSLGDTTVTAWITQANQSVEVSLRTGPTSITFDPDLTVLFAQTAPTVVPLSGERPLALFVPRPNPWRLHVTVDLALLRGTRLRVTVHDATGRLVQTLEDGPMQPGWRRLVWDGRTAAGTEVPPGVYLIRAASGDTTVTRRTVRTH
jgi:aminopeptidase N